MSNSRVKFYNEYDMASGWHLQKIEKIIDCWEDTATERSLNLVMVNY